MAKTITLTGTDVDGDSLTFIVTGLPTNGQLYDGTGTAGHHITLGDLPYTVTDPAGNVTYDPNADFNGIDSFIFKANDGTVDSDDAAVVTITVAAVNDAPVAANDSYGTITARSRGGRGDGLMGKVSRLGNALYEGDVSIDFVGRKWLWYSISGVIVLLAVGGLYFKGLNLGIEFEGGNEYNVSVGAGEATQDNVDKIRDAVADDRHQGRRLADRQHLRHRLDPVQTEVLTTDQSDTVVQAIADTVNVDPQDISARTPSAPSWGQQVAKQALTGLVVFLVLVVLFIWAYFREWKMSVAAHRRAGPRRRDHGRRLRAVRVRGHAGDGHRPAHDPRVLALRHGRRLRQGAREHQEPARASRTTYAEAANLAVNQTLVRSINTSIVALLPVGAILYVGVATLGSGALKDLALALFVGMAAGAYSSIFIATPLRRAAEVAREGDHRTQDAASAAREQPRRRPLRRRAGVHRGHAGARPSRMPIAEARRPTEHARAGRDRPPGGRRRPAPAGSCRPRRHPSRESRSVGPQPAQPPAALQATQEVTRRRAEATLDALIRDVPDFPKPGVMFKDITPLLADHGGVHRGRRRAAAAGRDERRARSWSTRWSGMEARGFILAAPVALALGAGSSRSARPASSRGRPGRCPTTWSTARRPSRCTPTPSRRGSGCWSSTTCWPPVAPPKATVELVEAARRRGARRSRCCSSCRSCTGRDRPSATLPLTALRTV